MLRPTTDGNVVFSDIASIRFDSTGAKSVVIDNIPAGSRVIVRRYMPLAVIR